MAIISDVRSEDIRAASLKSHNIKPCRELPAKIGFNTQVSVVTNPIDPNRISKKSTNYLTKSSLVKAGLVFFATVGGYYLAKTTNILSNFGWGIKNSKDINSGEITKKKVVENDLTVKRNLETKVQVNNPSINRISQMYKGKDRTVGFKEVKIEKFKNLPEVEKESMEMRKNFLNRRSIGIQNPISDQYVVVGKPFNLTIKSTHVFSTSGALSLEAINIPNWITSTPLNPRPDLKSVFEPPINAYEITLFENYAYVTPNLQIIDITNPANLTLKGYYDVPSEIVYSNSRAVILDNYAYMGTRTGLLIVDISNPSNPTFKSSYDIPDGIGRIAIFENYVYAPVSNSGLYILDVSNPENPTLKGSCILPNNAFEVTVSGNYAYVMYTENDESGLLVVDVSDPSNPNWLGLYEIPSRTMELAVSGNYVYVAAWDSGLQIIDISDPSNPTFKGSYPTNYVTYGVTISGNYAYVANSFFGLSILDISDPSNPIMESMYLGGMWFFAMQAAVSGNYAYVTGGILAVISLNPDKLILSGTPSSTGTYNVVIEVCNRAEECLSDSFNIIVKNSLPVDIGEGRGFSSTIISSMVIATCTACVASFFWPLIIGVGIRMFKRYADKILTNTNVKKLEEKKEQQKSESTIPEKDVEIVVND